MQRSVRATSNLRTHWARYSLSPFFEKVRREPGAVAAILSSGAISIDYAVAPVLNTWTPALASILIFLLLSRHFAGTNISLPSTDAPGIKTWRLVVFLVLHAALVTVAWQTIGKSPDSPPAIHLPGLAVAAGKYLVLLPTVFMLPWQQWRKFGRGYQAELTAAAVALLTVYPYRVFAMSWPWYCQGLGRLAHALARPLVAGLVYVPLPTPTLSGPNLDVRILFACSGLEAIKLFQIVFAVMLVLDWTHLNKRRTFLAYFAGMAAMLAANAVRIALLAITGNLAPRLTIQNHLTLGWIFFACVAALLIAPLYAWVMPRRAPSALATT